ncbi:MAG: hypothetical protein II007_01440 [Gammaproteobacteria bacterium]|nr:hypothetical protein [Gammaproteobacteria bacterium]
MRKALATTIAVLISGLTIASAQAALSGNLGATSNYIWRGQTQTSDSVGFSGGLDYAHDSGFYVGTWTSNVDFGDDASYELDGYFGFGGSIGDFGYDLNYTYFAYPDGEKLDFSEVGGSVSYSVLTLGANATASNDDGQKLFKGAYYYYAALSFDVGKDLALGFHIGQSDFDQKYGGKDYVDYNVSLTKTFALGDATFMISDTDIDEDDPKVVVSWSTGFDL